ncbi:MAG: PLP-dependent aminotransferase family protein [Rhodospirillaceae bacterium]|nr:PLP-dependent aminotransferase family protein [Rhodospirillaceae bacterium]
MGHDSKSILFHLEPDRTTTLQAQLRRMLVSSILDGQIPPGSPLPSCRALAQSLKIARNTVVLAYQDLTEEGFLISRERSGFFVNPDIVSARPRDMAPAPGESATDLAEPDWVTRFKSRPSQQRNVVKPANWQDYPYPFIYGQIDQSLFPLAAWRECSRQALSVNSVRDWAKDRFGDDDPLLIEQIRTRLLPRRGVRVTADEILVTVGAQQALYLLSTLLFDHKTTFGIEDPGYTDARNIAALRAGRLVPLPVDEQGLALGSELNGCDYVYVTPSHQFPTTATMSLERRHALLERAEARDFVLIEDDYESELTHHGSPQPALKSLDRHGRVIFVSSLSKTLAPGLRLGFLVAPKPLVAELRALRRLMIRHPAANNQRTIALFLADGHHDTLLRRLCGVYRERLAAAVTALAKFLPEFAVNLTAGGTALWIRGPRDLDMAAIAAAAERRGVVIEPGAVHFMAQPGPANFCRLGVSSIPTERIEAGIRLLAEAVREQG